MEDIMGFLPEKELSEKCRGVCFAAVLAVLNVTALLPAGAETVATFTRNPSNPILRGVRIGGEIAAKSLDAEIVHFIPRSEAPAEQLGLVDEVVRIKPDAIVFAPFDPKAMVPAVDKLNAAGIPVTNVNERLAGGNVVAYVGTNDYQLALTTARYLINAMGKKGNVVILEGPDNLPTSIARVGLQGRAQGISRRQAPRLEVGELCPCAGDRSDEELSATLSADRRRARSQRSDGDRRRRSAQSGQPQGAGRRHQCQQRGDRLRQVR